MSYYETVTTLTGMSIPDLIVYLDAELPPGSYKAVPGGAGLTDIDPSQMKHVLNRAFGMCGLGWSYAYEAHDLNFTVETRKTSNGGTRTVYVAVLTKLVFSYQLKSATTESQSLYQIPASGSSENSNAAYALKGAITNALGSAVSNIGFQESVYVGARSHATVAKRKPAPAVQKTVAAKGSAAKPKASVSKPTPPPAPAVPKSTPVAAGDDLENFVITMGHRKGKTFSQVWNSPDDQGGKEAIAFFAKMATKGDPSKESLKRAATAYLAQTAQTA